MCGVATGFRTAAEGEGNQNVINMVRRSGCHTSGNAHMIPTSTSSANHTMKPTAFLTQVDADI